MQRAIQKMKTLSISQREGLQARRKAALVTPSYLEPAAMKGPPQAMLAELRDDNKALAGSLRQAHNLCDEHRDIATASSIEVWIDEAEHRTWFLFEASRRGDADRP